MLIHCHLQESPKALIKTDYVADIKNMYQAYYKGNRMVLTEAAYRLLVC